MRTVTSAAATALLFSLTACNLAEDAARDVASDAACGTAQAAVDEAARQVDTTIPDIDADPQAAEARLQAVRDTLAVAEVTLDGDLRADVTNAKNAVESLLTQARAATEGATVDDAVVDAAQAELDAAVADVKDVC